MIWPNVVGALIAVGIVGGVIGMMLWSNRQAEHREAAMRRTIIDTTQPKPKPVLERPDTSRDEARRRLQEWARQHQPKTPPATPTPNPVTDQEIEHYAAMGIMDAQYMLDLNWKAKGYDQ